MALDRLRIELCDPWGKVTDLDTGETVDNITSILIRADAGQRPVVTLTFEVAEALIETDTRGRPFPEMQDDGKN